MYLQTGERRLRPCDGLEKAYTLSFFGFNEKTLLDMACVSYGAASSLTAVTHWGRSSELFLEGLLGYFLAAMGSLPGRLAVTYLAEL